MTAGRWRITGLLAATGSALVAVTSCGTGSSLPSVLQAAPEPANAPQLARVPAGKVISLGVDEPEGVVATAGGVVAVAARRPDALVLLDADLAERRVVPVPGAARHLELGTGTLASDVFVPGEDTDIVSTVSLPTGAVTSRVKVGRQPHDLTDIGTTVVVADELGGAVTAIDTATGATTLLKGPVQPGGVAGSAGRAAVVDVRGRLLYVYQPAPLKLLARVPVGAGPTHAVSLGAGLVVVADTSGGRLLVVRITGKPAVLTSVALPGRPYGLAVDRGTGTLYAATGSDNTLHAFAVRGAALTATRTWPTVRQPNSVAVEPATHRVVVVGATRDGQLQLITP